MPLFAITAVPSRSESKRARLLELLKTRNIQTVDEDALNELRAALAPVSGSYLRQLLIASDVPLSPGVEGVSQRSFGDLERTLIALQAEYETGDPIRRGYIRKLVIEGKDRARWSAQRAENAGKRDAKAEMLLWILTWLENPAAFPQWVALRRKALQLSQKSF